MNIRHKIVLDVGDKKNLFSVKNKTFCVSKKSVFIEFKWSTHQAARYVFCSVTEGKHI
jgi:hypothetical protein